MANPSLQIGNDNWAIKEDNLLGYSTAGTRFVPQPITMTRATAGTRVNSSGVVETVELLGSELVVNGDFSSDTDWIKAPSGVTISGGSVNFNSASDTYVYQDILTTTKTYKIIFSGTINSGSLYIGENGVATNTYTAGTYTNEVAYFTVASSSRFIIRKTGVGTLDATIDNISVKESTIDNLPRVDYTDGTSSLLVEPQRTNLLTYSEDFSNASWTKVGSSVTPNATTSPDGTINADKLVEDTSTGGHQIQSITSASNSTIYTTSVFVKYAGREWIRFTDAQSSNRIHFNTLTGVFGTISGTVIDYNKTALENGWYKLSFTTTSVASAYTPRIALAEADNDVSYTGDGVSGVYIYGCSLEEGSYATSYIPTSGSTVTRNQETYTKTGISDKINSEEGVLFLEASALSNDGTSRCISIFQNGSNFIKFLYSASSNRVDFVAFSGGNVSCNITKVITNTTENTKFALKWKVNDFALWIDGTEVGTDLSGDAPLGMDKMYFTDEGGSGSKFFGKVKQLQVFKTALSDSELATLTT